MGNNINNKKRGKFITGRRIFLLIPLIVLIFVIANHYSCVMSGGTLCCLDGLSEGSRILIYNLIFYFYLFYIFYLVAYLFTKNHSNRIFVAVVVTFLVPFIIVGLALAVSNILAAVALVAVVAPGILFDEFLSDSLDIKDLSVKQLMAPTMMKSVSVLWEEARYQGDSLIVPVLISGKYLRAIQITPKAINASDQIISLFTVGPRSTPIPPNNMSLLTYRHELEADYEQELLNRGILSQEEWDISEWNPIVWNAITQQGNLIRAFRVKQDNMPTVLLALIYKKGGAGSNDLWLFDQKNLEKPINLTLSAFDYYSERRINSFKVSKNLNWIYVLGDIKYQYDFARITLSGNRDERFDQEWNTFLDSSGFSRTTVTAFEELRNGCLIVAFSPERKKSYPAKWLRLVQYCGDNGFELIGDSDLQVPFELHHSGRDINASKIYELDDDNLLIVLNGQTVVKFNLKNKKFDHDFQKNFIHTLQLIPFKENEELQEGYSRKVTSFVMLTPHQELIFQNRKKTLKIIVTDINGIKLFETDNF